MRNPLIRNNIEPFEIIKSVKETVENLHLEADPRFSYLLSQGDNVLRFELKLR